MSQLENFSYVKLNIDNEKHYNFLSSKPFDPITGDCIESGDDVAVCACCNAVFLTESLDYIGWQHCNQNKFTGNLPSVNNFLLKKTFRISNKANKSEIFTAWFLDNVGIPLGAFSISVYGSIFMLFLQGVIEIISSSELLLQTLLAIICSFVVIYNATRDAWLNGQSLGKKMVKVKVIDNKTGKKCSVKKALLRTLCSPLHIVTPIMWALGKDSLVDSLSDTSVVKDRGKMELNS